MGKIISKNISKKVSGKYRQKQSATGAFKPTSKRAILKAASRTSDLIGNKHADSESFQKFTVK